MKASSSTLSRQWVTAKGLRVQETYQEFLTQYKQDGKKIHNASPMFAVRGLKKDHVLKTMEAAKHRTKCPTCIFLLSTRSIW
ncbi:hypothetical protein PsorP6_016461 [Peronosclerospora sorghi]|uniref:Uncharacterized protein n=1 Tax=Peronosclerospora sorghi TaxID=230839 RepID=A0ACC0VK57_9STRA|nr:hypothetical protein PsorP6_016461 [Peronosclerospora sorghi]